MVLEDLSPFETGEPNGFKLATSKLLLENLAVLHAEFWKAPFFSEPPTEDIKPRSVSQWSVKNILPNVISRSLLKCFKFLTFHLFFFC